MASVCRVAAASKGAVARVGARSGLRLLSSRPDPVLNAPESHVTKLSNGIRVASEARSGDVASVSVSVDCGSRYETESNNGASAVLKALAFEGKQKEVALLGGDFTAQTSREETTFTATVHKSQLPKAMEVLAGAVKATGVSEGSMAAGKAAAHAAIRAAAMNPDAVIFEHLHDAAYLDSSMGLSSLGTDESVAGLSADQVQAFAKQGFSGSRVVVGASGAVDQAAVSDLTSNLLGDLPVGDKLSPPMAPGLFTGSDKRMRFDSMELCNIAIAFEGASTGSKDVIPLMMLQSVLGSYDYTSGKAQYKASAWARSLAADEAAICGSVFNINYKDTGMFGISGVTVPNKAQLFTRHALEHLVRMVHELTDEEVVRAKQQLKTDLLLKEQGAAATASSISSQVRAYGRRVGLAEMLARIDAVTTEDMTDMANRTINDKDHALAAVGPIHELPDYNWIRRRSYWLRY